MADTTTETLQEPTGRHSLLSTLRSNEQHYLWKAGLRAVICVINVIAIGCAAWLLSTSSLIDSDSFIEYYGFPGSSVGSLVVLCVSFVWCLLCIVIPFALRPPRAMHPGIAVGVDLIFWLAFIVVALFTLGTVYDLTQFGSDPTFLSDPSYDSSYYGNYYLAPNNTWVYNITSAGQDAPYYNYTTGEYEYPSVDTSNVIRDCEPLYATCAEQDAAINNLWHQKGKRTAVDIVVDAVEWLDVILHFTLFVWACVETHRRNSNKRVRAEQVVADRIIADLERKGLITVRDGVVVQGGGAREMTEAQMHGPAAEIPGPSVATAH